MDFRIFFKLAAFQGFGVGEAWRYHRPAKLPIRPMKTLLLVLTLSAGFAMPCAFAQTPNSATATPSQPDLATPQEKHLHNVRQLTIAPLMAEAMRRIHDESSVSSLFD